jgi:hypothetical protein
MSDPDLAQSLLLSRNTLGDQRGRRTQLVSAVKVADERLGRLPDLEQGDATPAPGDYGAITGARPDPNDRPLPLQPVKAALHELLAGDVAPCPSASVSTGRGDDHGMGNQVSYVAPAVNGGELLHRLEDRGCYGLGEGVERGLTRGDGVFGRHGKRG